MAITIFTDGGCSGNPGPGGWAFVVVEGEDVRYKMSGGESFTTNNKMELTAVINALLYAKRMGEDSIAIHTDSQYVKNGITQWIHNWKRKGWKTAGGDCVKNQEYWQKLDTLSSSLSVSWNWVKGHAGISHNELCDTLVGIEMAKFRK